MSLLQAAILGIIQGMTEFIPVSSSGHLVLAPHLLGWDFEKSQVFIFDVLVQWGTLLAVIVYFRTDTFRITSNFTKSLLSGKPFENKDARTGWFLIVATIPVVIIGFLYKDLVEIAFTSAKITGYFLLVTAALLGLAEYTSKRSRTMDQFTWFDALLIGCFQVLALLPGVSRSGATIAGGMFRGFNSLSAAKFSFLMSIPVMFGAGILAITDLIALQNTNKFLFPLLVGFLSSMISGYVAIRWMIAYLSKRSLYIFAGYCFILGGFTILTG